MNIDTPTLRRRGFTAAAVTLVATSSGSVQALATACSAWWHSPAGPAGSAPAAALAAERRQRARAPNTTTTRLRINGCSTTRIRLQRWLDRSPYAGRELPPVWDDENNYWAQVIEDGDRYYYRAKGVTVEMTQGECCLVLGNPHLYYFSTALKLHLRIKRAAPSLGPETLAP
jgi:hypothetical protein